MLLNRSFYYSRRATYIDALIFFPHFRRRIDDMKTGCHMHNNIHPLHCGVNCYRIRDIANYNFYVWRDHTCGGRINRESTNPISAIKQSENDMRTNGTSCTCYTYNLLFVNIHDKIFPDYYQYESSPKMR